MVHLIDKDAIKPKVQEKLLKACTRLYEAERALCEMYAPQSWKDVVKEHGFTHWCYVEDLLKL